MRRSWAVAFALLGSVSAFSPAMTGWNAAALTAARTRTTTTRTSPTTTMRVSLPNQPYLAHVEELLRRPLGADVSRDQMIEWVRDWARVAPKITRASAMPLGEKVPGASRCREVAPPLRDQPRSAASCSRRHRPADAPR